MIYLVGISTCFAHGGNCTYGSLAFQTGLNKGSETGKSLKSTFISDGIEKMTDDYKPLVEITSKDTCGDVIVMINFMELKCRFVSIKDSIIEYRSCYESEGTNSQMSIRNIRMIRLLNDSIVYLDSTYKKDLYNPTCDDIIVFDSGKTLHVKVLYVDENCVKYVDCKTPGVVKRYSSQIIYNVLTKNKSLKPFEKPERRQYIDQRVVNWSFFWIDFSLGLLIR